MSRVRKIKNISNVQVPVAIDQFTKIYIAPGEMLENKQVYNLGAIRQFCEVEEDLAEVNPVSEGRQKLYD